MAKNNRGGARPGAGRKPSPALTAIRAIINDPTCIENALEQARKDPEFWFKLYQQIHGRPAQAVSLTHRGDEDSPIHIVRLPDGNALDPAIAGLPATGTAELSE